MNLSWVWGWGRKSIPRITVWHHKACWVMTNGDREGRSFVSNPHTNNRFFFFCSPLHTAFSYLKKAPKSSWIRWDVTYHDNVTLTYYNDSTNLPNCCSFLYLSHWLVQGKWDRISHTPDRDFRCFYLCEIILFHIPIPALGKDKQLTAAHRMHAGHISIRDVITMSHFNVFGFFWKLFACFSIIKWGI